MCDYSLHATASRPARVGDKLVATQFRNSITHGVAAVAEPQVAVSLLPGTEVAFEQEVKYTHSFAWFRNRTTREKVARFRQVNLHDPNTHRDTFEFPSGTIVLVTRLVEDQRLTVLQLPNVAQARDAHETQSRPASMIIDV